MRISDWSSDVCSSDLLKTPLTLLSTQATYALRTADAAERQETLQALQANTRQTSRLANQLLTLARAAPGSRRPRHELNDLAAAARQVLEQPAHRAVQPGPIGRARRRERGGP